MDPSHHEHPSDAERVRIHITLTVQPVATCGSPCPGPCVHGEAGGCKVCIGDDDIRRTRR